MNRLSSTRLRLAPSPPILISCPSACTANMVQDLIAFPSTSTVHAPQFVVSQPMWVPVSPRPWRIRWESSSRGSTSAAFFMPLIVNLIRRMGTSPVSWSPRSSYTVVMSGRPFRGLEVAAQQPDHKGAHHVPLVFRAAAVVGPGPGRLRGELGRLLDALGGQRLPGQGAGRGGNGDGRSAHPGPGNPRPLHRPAGGLQRHPGAHSGEVADPAIPAEI